MKKLIILIAIIPTLIFGQTVIEKETFRIMNEYRISNGLKINFEAFIFSPAESSKLQNISEVKISFCASVEGAVTSIDSNGSKSTASKENPGGNWDIKVISVIS
jgi:hypothetical protein